MKPACVRGPWLAVVLLGSLLSSWAGQSRAQPSWVWSTKAGGSADNWVEVVVDPLDNVIAFGWAEDFDGIAFGGDASFVAKLNTFGERQWLLRPTSTGDVPWISAVATDPRGDIWVTGRFEGTLTLGSRSLTARAMQDAYLARILPDGTVFALQHLGYPDVVPTELMVDETTFEILVAGTLSAPGDFDEVPVAHRGGPDAFVAKLTPSGTVTLWVHTVAGPDHDGVQGLDVDPFGNVALVGWYERSAQSGGETLSARAVDGFVLHLNPDGSQRWIRQLYAGGSGMALDVAVTYDTAMIVAAQAADEVTLGGSTLDLTPPAGSMARGPQPMLIKFSGAGNVEWYRIEQDRRWSMGDVSGLLAWDFDRVAINDLHEVFWVAQLHSTALVDGNPVPGTFEGYLIKINPDSTFGYMRSLAHADVYGYPTSIALDGVGNLLVGASFRDVADIDGTPYETYPGYLDNDVVIGKLGLEVPRPDGHDDDDSFSDWQVTPWLCPPALRRTFGDDGLECPGVFENDDIGHFEGFVPPHGAEKIWSMTFQDLSLDDLDDMDRFHIVLPDPASAADGGDPDVRPFNPPYRPASPVPLRECWVTHREEFGPLGWPREITVSTHASLTLRVVPTANATADRPIHPDVHDRIRLYRGTVEEPSLGTGTALEQRIDCPRSDPDERPWYYRIRPDGTVEEVPGAPFVPTGKNLQELIATFGERDDVRALASTGGYTLEIEYKIEAHRGAPDWVLGESERDGIATLPCLGLGAGGFFGGSFGRFGSVPLCLGDGPFVIDLVHPLDPADSCLNDGPGCRGWFRFSWPHTWEQAPFELFFEGVKGLEVELWDQNQERIAHSYEGKEGQVVLTLDPLAAGDYLLLLSGPPQTGKVFFSPPKVGKVELGDVNLDQDFSPGDVQRLVAHVTAHDVLRGVAYLAGDVVKDQRVDGADLVELTRKALPFGKGCVTKLELLDIDGNGKLSGNDARCLAHAVVGDEPGEVWTCEGAKGPFDLDGDQKVGLADLACLAHQMK